MTLTRHTPLRRKRPTPRRVPDVTCAIGPCNLPPRIFQWCRKHAVKKADELFSRYVRLRDGRCQVCSGSEVPCDALECSHLLGRSKWPTRYDPTNAVAAHHSCHASMTVEPELWRRWCRNRLGDEAWGALVLKSEKGTRPDIGWVITELRERLKGMAA